MKKLNLLLLLGIMVTMTISLRAQVSFIKDIQPAINKNGSNPELFIEMNGWMYFVANEPSIGIELWRTNGTTTEMVKDIKQGSGSSSPNNLVVYHNKLYFQADDGTVGTELWRSDGTDNGTELVMDIYPGSSGGWGGYNSSRPQKFIIYKDTLFFQARDNNGYELWKSDGTDSGTVMVKNIYTGSGGGGGANSSYPQNFIIIDNVLYFSAASNSIGTELWKTDGSTTGTVLVKDINSGTSGSDPKLFVEMGNKLYFVGTTSLGGDELWRSDGTSAGTYQVKDILMGSGGANITSIVNYNGMLYFSADDGTHGTELWSSDGTTTQLFEDINTNTGSSPSYPGSFIIYNGKLYFTASDGLNMFEFWTSDGTTGGTKEVKDINVGGGSGSPDLYTVSNGILFFVASSTGVGNELWKSDGTEAGTVLVKDISSGTNSSNPRYLTAFSTTKELVFSADNGINSPQENREPWKSNGTSAGTVVVKEIVSGTRPSYPAQMVYMKNKVYFTAEGGTATASSGNELWMTDGTAAGTENVKDIITGTGNSSSPKYLTNMNDVLYFSASDVNNGVELFKSTGVKGNASIVKDINIGPYDGNPDQFCIIGGILYFRADDGVNGFELWKSDGTAANTVMIKDIFPGLGTVGANSSNPYGLRNINGTLYFRADDGVNGSELWKSDGTEAGTVLVKDIRAGADSSDIEYIFNLNGKALFQATNGTNGTELWISDGTEAGTKMLKDIYTGTGWGGSPNSSNPKNFCELNGKAYFQAAANTVGTELWRTDGTDTGTKILKDIDPSTSYYGARSSTPQYLTKVGNDIFFAATTRTNGTELWKTDGTTAGTVMFRDLYPGSKSSNPNSFTLDGTSLYFVATTSSEGNELWKTENNSCGKTFLTGQTNPGNIGAGPSNLCTLNGIVIFAAWDANNSTELWKYSPQFNYADTAIFNHIMCNGDSVKIGGKWYDQAGTYRDSLKTSTGCDSLILITITIHPTFANSKVYKRCEGDTVSFGGKDYTTSGTYYHNLVSKQGCDSIVTYNLTFTPKPPIPVITKTGTIQLTSSASSGNQWYDDNGKIAGATSQSYTTNGKRSKFYVIVTIDSCSSVPSNKMDPLGINDKYLLMNVEVYPNPVSKNLTIECEAKNIGNTFYINDMQGKTLMSNRITDTKNVIDVEELSSGVYFVKIVSDQQIGLIKFVKE